MRTRPASRLRSERGTTLVNVALALVTLMGLAAYAVDRGIVWISRGQAQNAADAGALAGAVARAYDDTADPPATLIPQNAALNLALGNPVWGTSGAANVTWTCPPGLNARCVRVDVYRNGEFSSPTLPVVFAPVLGISSQGVRATATAAVQFGNTVLCMRPFSVPDKWLELTGATDTYDHWITSGGSRGTELNPHDTYSGPGSGWDADASDGYSDIGTQFILKTGNNPQSDGAPMQSGWSFPVQLPEPGGGGYFSGAQDYRDAIGGCTAGPVSIGDRLPVETGVMNGPTGQGVGDLVAKDPTATFASSPVPHVDNTCAPGVCADGNTYPFSPRIVPISVFDVEEFQHNQATNDWSSCGSLGRCVKVVQIIGYFVEGMSGGDVVGRLMMYPGEFISGPTAPMGSQFLVKIQLVR